MASPLHGDRMYIVHYKNLENYIEKIIVEGWHILSAIPKPSFRFVYQQATVAFETNTHERKSNL